MIILPRIFITLTLIFLNACTHVIDTGMDFNNDASTYDLSVEQSPVDQDLTPVLYSQTNDNVVTPAAVSNNSPEQYQPPISAKNSDENWVASQDPSGYTIEVSQDLQPARVAEKLYQLPKNDRMAEIRTQQRTQVYYQGLYGSFAHIDAAQKALDNLPEAIKSQAAIKRWQEVQINQHF